MLRPIVLGLAIALPLFLLGEGEGQAVPIQQSFLLDQSNEFADGVPYGRLDITADSDAGTVQFALDALVDGDVGNGVVAGSSFGVQAFGFNTTLADGTITAGDFSLPAGWSLSIGSNSVDGFGKFEFKLSGSGSSREDPLAFSINNLGANAVIASFLELSTGRAGEGNPFFAAHIAGFEEIEDLEGFPEFRGFHCDDDEITSHFIGGSGEIPPVTVPEPSAWMLMLVGLGSLVLARRRRLILVNRRSSSRAVHDRHSFFGLARILPRRTRSPRGRRRGRPGFSARAPFL